MEGYDELKGSTWIVLVWRQYGGDICLKIIKLREGKGGVNKGGSKLINTHLMLCKSLYFL